MKNLYIQVVYNLNFENIEREIKYLSKQKGKKVLIYFKKDDDIILSENIEYINILDFIFEQ